jgi:hypothetical protein
MPCTTRADPETLLAWSERNRLGMALRPASRWSYPSQDRFSPNTLHPLTFFLLRRGSHPA